MMTLIATLIAALTQDAARPDLHGAAEALAAQTEIPAAAVVAARCGRRDSAVAGVADSERGGLATAQSRFNLGSNAKSMLATVAAQLVEDGLISWDTTVGESGAFADLDPHNPNSDATLADLFSHTSGLATYHSGADLNAVRVDGPRSAQARAFAEQALTDPPTGPRGAYAYSNAGPVVAAVMLEHAGGEDWLTLLETQLFDPWGLEAGLAHAQPGGAGEVHGHYTGPGGLTVYEDTEPEIPAFLQPSGYIAITPDGYARYLEAHVCALGGQTVQGLSAEALARRHEPAPGTRSALGWAQHEQDGRIWSFHIGSTGAHYAFAMLDDKVGYAVLVNSGSLAARQAALQTLLTLANDS